MQPRRTVVVVGAGVFGMTAALELAVRGHRVTILDPGPIPHPLAASTDISKVVRDDYGADAFHTDLMVEAYRGWGRWNRTWGTEVFHRTGFLLLTSTPMAPGGFEHDSHRLHLERGHAPERMDAATLAGRHPAWAGSGFVDGYRNPRAGWADAGAVMPRLATALADAGVDVRQGTRMAGLLEDAGGVSGVATEDGRRFRADEVVLAVGAWTPVHVPRLRRLLVATGHPALHLRPAEPAAFRPPQFPPWGADIARTGFYGFPLHPSGVVKVGRHAAGTPVDPDTDARELAAGTCELFAAFLAERLPALADAPVVSTRLCLYSDTADGRFLIARDPERDGLVVATGGSGHGFKFAPVLGGITADVVEGVPNRWAERFAWREDAVGGAEAARSSA